MKNNKPFLAYLGAALALAVLTLVILDGFNPLQRFLTSTPSKLVLEACCVAALINACSRLWKK